jgi:predicted ATPase
MYDYKLTHILFNDDTTFEPGELTVIVGPNNAGKSRALKDIVAKITANRSPSGIIVKDVKWTLPETLQDIREAYNVERFYDANGQWHFRVLNPELLSEHRLNGPIWPTEYEKNFKNHEFFAEHFGRSMVAFLTTEHRLRLVKQSASQKEEREAANLLQILFDDGPATEKIIRQLVKRAFDREVALDFTVLQRLILRVGDDFSALPPDPREARPIMQEKESLDEQGDGIRSFVGIIVTMLSIKRSLFLIDEPEAFLHPPQAFRIGEFLAEQMSKNRQIILATHSTDVLRGILNKTSDVSIIRMDRDGNTNSFKFLNPNRLKELVNDPLLSSARVLDGLFYSGAVVVEGDSDARFYQAAFNKQRVNADFHFVNADNKQTVPRITKMYQDMGVCCAGIVDFDVLNNREEFEKQLEALDLNEEEVKKAIAIRGNIATAAKEIPPQERLTDVEQRMIKLMAKINETQSRSYTSSEEATITKGKLLREVERGCYEIADSTKDWNLFKQKGRAALSPELQLKFDQLWQMCAAKGLFINPCGELESMLTEYGIPATTNKRGWITQALQLLPGLEVNDEKYPWKFIKVILADEGKTT